MVLFDDFVEVLNLARLKSRPKRFTSNGREISTSCWSLRSTRASRLKADLSSGGSSRKGPAHMPKYRGRFLVRKNRHHSSGLYERSIHMNIGHTRQPAIHARSRFVTLFRHRHRSGKRQPGVTARTAPSRLRHRLTTAEAYCALRFNGGALRQWQANRRPAGLLPAVQEPGRRPLAFRH